jgi:addiction module antidote protein HigA
LRSKKATQKKTISKKIKYLIFITNKVSGKACLKGNVRENMKMLLTKRKPSTVGDILLEEYLIPLNLKIADLAAMLNVHRNTVSAIVNNNSKLSLDMAMRLAKALNTSVEFWLNLQMMTDIWFLENDSRFQASLADVKTLDSLDALKAA